MIKEAAMPHVCRKWGRGVGRKILISVRITDLLLTEIWHVTHAENEAGTRRLRNSCVRTIQAFSHLSFICQETKYSCSTLLSNGFNAIKISIDISLQLTDIFIPERNFQHFLQLCGIVLRRRAWDPLTWAVLILGCERPPLALTARVYRS